MSVRSLFNLLQGNFDVESAAEAPTDPKKLAARKRRREREEPRRRRILERAAARLREPPTTVRNHSLDLVRGLCAVGVAAYHFLSWNYAISFQSAGTFLVYTFFVLSAVTMMMRYGPEMMSNLTVGVLQGFYRNRLARILPLLIAVLTLGLVYNGIKTGEIPGLVTLGRIALTGSGLFALHMPGFLSTSVGAWSLGIELMFYALFPAIALLVQHTSGRRLAAILFGLVVAGQVLLFNLPPRSDPSFWGMFNMPLTFAPFFAAGILIYRAPPAERPWNLSAAVAVLIAIFFYSGIFHDDLRTGGVHFVLLLGLSTVAVALAYRSHLPAWLVAAGAFLGEISYSLYLSHWIANDLAGLIAGQSWWKPIAFAILALALACVLTYFLERPARELLRARRQTA